MTQNITATIQELAKAEATARKIMAEATRVYRPLPQADLFHRSKCLKRLVRGGNQSSKSTCALMEVAASVLKRELIGIDGKPIPNKYSTKEALTWWVIGYGGKHIGETFYPKFFKPGLFHCIDDPETGDPRLWNPNNTYDAAHIDERYPSEPAIPEYAIESIAWENKGDNQISRCKLKNGNTLVFMTSGGQLVQGATINGGIWVDEDVEYPDYVNDWMARLAIQAGRFIWSAFPWGHNDALKNLVRLADEEADKPVRTVDKFQLTFSGNPFIPEASKQSTLAMWASQGPAVLRARDLGEYDNSGVKMYFDFDKFNHVLDPEKMQGMNLDDLHPVDRIMLENDGVPPADWTLCLALDPGSTKAGVGFYAVPPPSLGNFIVLYDEIFQEQSDAKQIADAVLLRTKGRTFQRFIIDNHAARRTPEGFGRTIRSVYVQEFERRKIRCQTTGSNFLNGSDHVELRCQMVRDSLKPMEQPLPENSSMWLPQLRVWGPRTPRFQWEIVRYERKIVKDEAQDVPIAVNCEMMQCLEYFTASSTRYVAPPTTVNSVAKQMWSAIDRMLNRDPQSSKKQTVNL